MLLHDGHAALGKGGRAVILDVLPRLLDTLGELGLEPITLKAALP